MPFLEYWDGTAWVPVQASGGGGAFRLSGFVEGGPAVDGVLATKRGPDALLSRLPAGGNVSLDGFRLTHVDAPQSLGDAVNLEFLWALLNDEIV